MKQILQDQTISFDTHQAGDGQPIDLKNLHMHKRMNGKRYKGVNIRIPFDPTKPIDYTGNNSKYADQIISEIQCVFKKDPGKVREMAKTIAKQIERYSKGLDPKTANQFLDDGARAIATFFGLNEQITESISQQIKSHFSFIITAHEDENGKKYYIKQDVDRRRLKIGDNLEKMMYGNGRNN